MRALLNLIFPWYFAPRAPGVLYCREMDMTEVLLRDTATVSVPFGSGGHVLDLLYDFDGELVGVRVWADVRKRNRRAG